MRGQRRVVALADEGALPSLLGELERRLEEVHEQPHRPVEPRQGFGRGEPLEPPVAHHPPHDGAVLLLDVGLVVLAIGPRAGERDPRRLTPGLHRLVDEHGVVVRVEPEKRDGQPFAHHRHHLAEQLLLAKEQRRALGPARRDVGEHQRLHEAPARGGPAVRHEIGLHEAGCGVPSPRRSGSARSARSPANSPRAGVGSTSAPSPVPVPCRSWPR